MLRITVFDDPGAVTFWLEGRLVGGWVQELHDCWEATLARCPRPAVRVDLTEVTYVDAAGKAFLAAKHSQGAELVAAGCLMRAIAAEIAAVAAAECPRSRRVPSVDPASLEQ